MIKTLFCNHSCNEPHLRIVTTKHSTLTTLFSPRTSHILNKKEAFFSVFIFSLRKQRLGGREMLLCQHLQDFIHATFHCCPRKLPLVFLYLDRKAKIFFYYLTVYPSPLSQDKLNSKSFDYNINSSYTFSNVSFKVGSENLVTYQGNILPNKQLCLPHSPSLHPSLILAL